MNSPGRSLGPPRKGSERQRPLHRPPDPGVYTVTAESSGVTGSTRIHVLQADTLYLTDEATGKRPSSYSLTPGRR